jgi:hypothetical protein
MHSGNTDERKRYKMKRITTEALFECIQQWYQFNVMILIDDVAGNLRFHFKAAVNDTERLPLAARNFDVITTFHKHIIFNRLAVSNNPLQEAVKECVEEYVRSFTHPLLNRLGDTEE